MQRSTEPHGGIYHVTLCEVLRYLNCAKWSITEISRISNFSNDKFLLKKNPLQLVKTIFLISYFGARFCITCTKTIPCQARFPIFEIYSKKFNKKACALVTRFIYNKESLYYDQQWIFLFICRKLYWLTFLLFWVEKTDKFICL